MFFFFVYFLFLILASWQQLCVASFIRSCDNMAGEKVTQKNLAAVFQKRWALGLVFEMNNVQQTIKCTWIHALTNENYELSPQLFQQPQMEYKPARNGLKLLLCFDLHKVVKSWPGLVHSGGQWSPTLILEMYLSAVSSSNHNLPHLLQLISFLGSSWLAGSEALVLGKEAAFWCRLEQNSAGK